MSLIDRQWAGHWVSLLMSPIAAPSVDDVRELLFRYFEEVPTAGLASIVDLRRGVWIRVPTSERRAFVERMVVPGADPEPDARDAYQLRHQAPADWDLATKIVVGPTSILVSIHHVLGDGATLSDLATTVANLDLEGVRRQEPRATTGTIARASGRHARSYAGRWVSQVRSRRTTRPDVAGVEAPQPGQVAAAPAARVVAGTATPGQLSVMIEDHELAAMTAWGRTAHPTARLSSVLTGAFYRALRAQDLPVNPAGFNALVDVRRYLLPSESGISGNLAKALFVATDDLGDPTSVAAAQAALIDSGWTLPSLALGAVLASLPGRKHTGPSTATVGGPLTMNMSVMSSLPGLSDIAWLEGGRTRFTGIGYPVGLDVISLFAVRMPDHLEVSLSYAREAVPDETARTILDLLHDIPALFGG
jgi:hypothetical protein